MASIAAEALDWDLVTHPVSSTVKFHYVGEGCRIGIEECFPLRSSSMKYLLQSRKLDWPAGR